VGDGWCVDLVKAAANTGLARNWHQGVKVQGNPNIRPGTIIATFDKNSKYNGHAAIFVSQNKDGIVVIDQYFITDKDGKIIGHQPPHERTLEFGKTRKPYVDRGEFFYVVE
jgi:hypothetical protein